MIRSEREYETRKAFVRGMEQAVAHADVDLAGQHPLLQEATREAQLSLLEEAREEVAEYEALRDGRLMSVPLMDLYDLGPALRRARLAAGLTKVALAERAGLTAEQVRRYETSDYRDAPLAHCQAIVAALRGRLQIAALLPARPIDEDAPSRPREAPRPQEIIAGSG